MSTAMMTVSSRSSQNVFTKGVPVRAVTFQSMLRISSPGTYSRTASNSIPRPLKTLRYSPASRSFTCRRATIWMRRTSFRTSSSGRVGMALGFDLGHGDRFQHLADDVVGRGLLGFGLVGKQHAVAENVERHVLDILRRDIGATDQEGIRAGR